MQKNKVYSHVKTNVILIHGVYSDGENFVNFKDKLINDDSLFYLDMRVSIIDYDTLFLAQGRTPWARGIVAKYVAARLAACTYKYPNARTVVIAHSFGTYAIARAIQEAFSHFRVNTLILLGSVVKRGFEWDKYQVSVYNFVGKKDYVVLASALWGTGWSGRFGFKRSNSNVTEFVRDWSHSDYMQGYDDFVEIIKNSQREKE